MRRSWYRIAGIHILVISVFFLLGGIFIPAGEAGSPLAPALLTIGVILLIAGTWLYKIIKVEE